MSVRTSNELVAVGLVFRLTSFAAEKHLLALAARSQRDIQWSTTLVAERRRPSSHAPINPAIIDLKHLCRGTKTIRTQNWKC